MTRNYNTLYTLHTHIVQYADDSRYYAYIIQPDINDRISFDLFVLLSEKMSCTYEGNELQELIDKVNNAISIDEMHNILNSGVDNFIPGEDYFIPQRTAVTIEGLDESYIMPDLFEESFGGLVPSGKYMYDLHIDNKIHKNILLSFEYTKEELGMLPVLFFNTILSHSSNEDLYYGQNVIYKSVMKYYASNMNDDAKSMLQLILNSTVSSTSTVVGSCCNSGCTGLNKVPGSTGNSINIDEATCTEKYDAAMFEYLKKMLSDLQFYCDWMTEVPEDNPLAYEIDYELIDALIKMLEEFLNAGFNLSNIGSSNTNWCNCHSTGSNSKCPDASSYNDNCSNASIIKNYIQVLKWVRNDEVNYNKNKITAYGTQFAELLPKLYL